MITPIKEGQHPDYLLSTSNITILNKGMDLYRIPGHSLHWMAFIEAVYISLMGIWIVYLLNYRMIQTFSAGCAI